MKLWMQRSPGSCRKAILAVSAACVVAGCGSSSSSQLSAAAAKRMNQALVETRAAADAHDREKAIRALSVLLEIATHEAQAGRLSAAEERTLRTGIAQARRRVALDVTAPQPTPPPEQPAPAPQSAPEQQGEAPDKDVKDNKQNKEGKGRGKGKGKG